MVRVGLFVWVERRRVFFSMALMLTTALSIVYPGLPASAQSPGHSIAQAGQRTFDIPSQPLNEALVEFGRQAGMSASADTSLTQSQRSAAVKGTMTWQQALTTLLSGTGLTYRLNGSIVTLERPNVGGAMQLDPVQVQGYPVPWQAMIDNLPPPYAGGQVATGGQLGLLGNRPVMDTPFNQTNYTAKKAQDQQAKSIRDVLIDDPSVAFTVADGGYAGEGVWIRGFNVATQSYSYGGLYGMLPSNSVMAELAERVEVLKGPSAMLNGMPPVSMIGGTVNVVPKRAPDEPLAQLTASYVSSAQFGGHADVARRFGPDKQFGVRFNGVFKAGESEVRWNSDQRALAVLGLDFRGDRARFSADLGYQSQYVVGATPYLGVANNVPMIWAPIARNNPGSQPWASVDRKDLFGVFRAEVDLTERITAYASFGAHDFRFANLAGSDNFVASSFNGNVTARPYLQNYYQTFRTGQAGLRALVDTGPIGHEFAFSVTTLESETGTASISGTPYTTNLYSPTLIARPNFVTPVANKTSTSGQSSLAVADTLSAADKRIQLTIGARLQRVTAANFNATTGAQTTSYDESALSPSVALVFKPWQNVSVYGNWIQGLQQGAIVGPTFTNAGEVFPPYKSTQYEAGIKADWGKFTTTASVFQISQPSILTDVTTNTQFLGGERRNQGLELNVFGEPMEGVRLLGGAMFLSSVLTKTQGGLTDGWIAPGSPSVQFRLAGEWDTPFVPGLTMTGRVLYTGSQYIDTTWPRRSLAEWTRFDLGARYAFENPGAKGKLLVARFAVENVLDANYWAGGTGAASTLMLGAPRTFRLSLTADF